LPTEHHERIGVLLAATGALSYGVTVVIARGMSGEKPPVG
jgi:hypothetical protein